MTKIIPVCLCVLIAACCMLAGCSGSAEDTGEKKSDKKSETGILSSAEELNFHETDGSKEEYSFTYDGKEFKARYSDDNWTIFDSYRILNEDDIRIICKKLIDIHPVHGSDLKSYRTPDDMAYEWQQHNLAFIVLPKDDPLRENAKNVDLDPADQGRSLQEIYEDRTGRPLAVE